MQLSEMSTLRRFCMPSNLGWPKLRKTHTHLLVGSCRCHGNTVELPT